jgi:hypothetical protein
MVNLGVIMKLGGTCIKLMIFASADDGVDDETIREKFGY